MPKYLNSHQKEIITNLAAFHIGFEDIVDTWEELDRPMKWKKYLKTARTYIMKTMEEMLDGVNEDQVISFIDSINRKEIILRYNDKAQKERKKKREMDDTTVLSTDEFYDFINAGALANCKGCTDDARECELKEMFLKYEVPIASYSELSEGECPYKL